MFNKDKLIGKLMIHAGSQSYWIKSRSICVLMDNIKILKKHVEGQWVYCLKIIAEQ